MAGLPWFRMDSNIASHDKILELLADRAASKGDRFQAAFSFVSSMGHCSGHGTDGLVKFVALPHVHGTKRTAELLVDHGLWAPHPLGWTLPGWDKRNPSAQVTELKRAGHAKGAAMTNCKRWHPAGCTCTEEDR